MIKTVEAKYFKMAVGVNNLGKVTNSDISARCPICGDSKKNKNSKRLHIYNKGTNLSLVRCFNGECTVNHNIYSFLRDYYPAIFEQYKRETFQDNISDLKDSWDNIELNLPKEDTKNFVITHHDLTSHFIELSQSTKGLEYLRGRKINYYPEKFGKWYFGKHDIKIGDKTYYIQDAIIIPLYENGIMYGFYSRKIAEKIFFTYNPEVNLGYKIWNWFNVNLNEPLYIFESIFDAISSGKTNIIALMGAKLPEDRLKEIKEPIFCLDNDKTGIKNSIEYAQMGYKVLVLPDSIKEKDMNEIMKNHDFNMSEFVDNNIESGISAIVKLKLLL